MLNKMNNSKKISSINSKQHIYYPIKGEKEQIFSLNSTCNEELNPLTEKVRRREIDSLKKNNIQFRDRESMYINKLMMLQQGLEQQHQDFIKLQELYIKLLGSYKEKQIEVSELERKFKETEKCRQPSRKHQFNKFIINESQGQYESLQKQFSYRQNFWKSKQNEWNQKQQEYILMIQSLGSKLAKIDTDFQKMMLELSCFKNKENLRSSKKSFSGQMVEEIQKIKQQATIEKQSRLKFQYENQFLKCRNQDLEDQRKEFQNLLTYKQQEINKLRNNKIRIHRQSSEKMGQQSPSKTVQSRVSFNSSGTDLNSLSPYQKNKLFQLQNSLQPEEKTLNHYFSFSRQRFNQSGLQELPNLPVNLQIDTLINSHSN